MGIILRGLVSGGIARLSVNTLELAGGFHSHFPYTFRTRCFPRIASFASRNRSFTNEVLLLLFWQSSARDILIITRAVF